ncbi:MAG: hypothetical protein AB7U38_03005 [Hyphomicrobiales bacterium]
MTLLKATGRVLVCALLICAAGSARAEENCGDPCRDDQYWTDKGGGKCLPIPKDDMKTS